MNKINWGIIGCGDVTEIKSGQAFNKVKNSALVAVMRRDAEKAKDYARRHNVPKWYSDAYSLINDPDVNAISIATPPSSHEEYTIAALQAGKHVYVEKPMTVNFASATRMAMAAKEKGLKLSVAHYRREMPLFKKIKELLAEKRIGDIRFVKLELYKRSVSNEEMAIPMRAWRVDAAVAGGGLFHDLSPHQLDLMYYYFGEIDKASGYSANQEHLYNADDIVTGNILFKSGVIFSGIWCFNVAEGEEKDQIEIFGSKGKISFSVFEMEKISITENGKMEVLVFDQLQHVQQPIIGKIVDHFLDEGPNPCSGDDGAQVMWLIDQFAGK